MRSAPSQGYHNPLREELPERVGHTAMSLLETIGDRELPDATLTDTQRQLLREKVRAVEPHLSSHELMFLAGAFETAANRKRAQEEATAR